MAIFVRLVPFQLLMLYWVEWISVVGWGQLLAVFHVWLSAVWLAAVVQCPITQGTDSGGICRGSAAASEEFTRLEGGSHPGAFSSQPAGSRRDCTILDLHAWDHITLGNLAMMSLPTAWSGTRLPLRCFPTQTIPVLWFCAIQMPS